MKIQKVIAVIMSANLMAGVAAFAQDDASKSSQDQQQDPSAQTPPSLPNVDEPAGAATGSFDKDKFLKETAKSGVAEVNMAQIGTQKAQDPSLKEASQKIGDDHTKLNEQIKALAQQKNVTLSTEIDQKHQKMIDHLSSLSGSEFDKAFASHMVKGHKKSIAKFQQAAQSDDAEISQLATAALPTLKEHLTMVQKWAPDTTAGSAVDEPAGAEPQSGEEKDDSSSAPQYKSPSSDPSDPEKSDSPK